MAVVQMWSGLINAVCSLENHQTITSATSAAPIVDL